MAKDFLVFLLLRKKLLPLLEALPRTLLPDASLKLDGIEQSVNEFGTLIAESLRYQQHGRDWYLCGKPIRTTVPQVLKASHNFAISYLDLKSYVEELALSYSWCLLPWGIYGTGQMIAFVSSNQEISSKFVRYLSQGNRDLLMPSYTSEQVKTGQFKGALFLRTAESRGRELWKYGRGPSDSVLVLNYQPESSPAAVPKGAEVLVEALGQQLGNPIRRRWICIREENALQFYAGRCDTIIITTSDLDERVAWLALQDFAEVAERVNHDPLYFALKALETASWIYVPTNYDEKWDIYINHDPTVTTRLLESEDLIQSPHFLHKYFC